MRTPSPRRLYRVLATAEAVTWTLLLVGMFLKYVTGTTELGVRIGGMLHGVVFIAYGLATLGVWVDGRWSSRQGLVALGSAIPPLATLWAERWLGRSGLPATSWRLSTESAVTGPEKVVAQLLRHPAAALLLGVVAVALLTTIALAIGPPVPKG